MYKRLLPISKRSQGSRIAAMPSTRLSYAPKQPLARWKPTHFEFVGRVLWLFGPLPQSNVFSLFCSLGFELLLFGFRARLRCCCCGLLLLSSLKPGPDRTSCDIFPIVDHVLSLCTTCSNAINEHEHAFRQSLLKTWRFR